MNKATKPSLPSISMLDDKGVQWTLDSDAGRWVAVVDGKKISSKDYDILRDKVTSKIAAQPNENKDNTTKELPPEAPKPLEVALIAMSNSSSYGGNGSLDLMKTNFTFKPVLAKIEWNAAKGAHEVVRYKEKDSGWKSSQTENLVLFHPQFLSDGMKSLLARSLEGTLVHEAFVRAENAIGDAWWSQKQDQTINWNIEYQKGLQPTQHRANSGNYSSMDYTSSAWLSAEPVNERDFSAWKSNPDGSLQLGSTQVRMQPSKHGAPSFYLYAGGQEDPLFNSNDLSLVLTLGNATHFISSEPAQVVSEWNGSADWQSKANKNRSWPKLREVHGAVLISGPRDNYGGKEVPQSYILSTEEKSLFKEEYALDQTSGRAWRKATAAYGAPTFRLAGPEDAELERLIELHKQMFNIADTHGLNKVNGNALKDLTPEVLREVSGAIEDGEELTTDLDTMDRMFTNMRNSLAAKVSQLPRIIEWTQACKQVQDEAVQAIEVARSKPQPSTGGKKLKR
jgi:hypothetical protein